MNISMIGAGYVGLVSAACFSEFGWTVKCVDKDLSKIENLRQGKLPIYEPRLDELLHRNLRMGRIAFSSDLAPCGWRCRPRVPRRRHADAAWRRPCRSELRVSRRSKSWLPISRRFTVICTKSTVPVGTSREIERRLTELRPDADFAVCSNPEFLREGSAI